MNFIYSFFNQPAIIIGLISFIGLVALKKPIQKIVTGTTKTIIGFLILSAGGGIIASALGTLGPAFENAFNVQGVIPANEAVIGIAENLLGTEMSLIMAFGFLVNILVARFTNIKYIFLSGHHVLFMAALLAAVLSTAGFVGVELIAVGSFLLGSFMAISPAIVQPFYRQVTGNDDIAMGHFNAVNYALAGLIGKWFGNKEKSTEDLKIPEGLGFFRDNTISTALVMIIIYLSTFLFADAAVIADMSGGDNVVMFAIVEALRFTAGFVIVLQGVRMMLAEIVPAFKGISDKLVPNSTPALDVPVIFPYAPNAVLLGFVSSVVGAFIMFSILPFFDLPLIIPGLIPLFFVGAGAGVLANATGGVRGTVIGGIVNGLLLILLPAILLPLLGELGFANSTFGDADFAFVGIVLGYLFNWFGKIGIYTIVAAILVYFGISIVKKPKEVKI
ncbi:PTS ascorbate transporter subunit IIC [Alkalibacterium sp. 20]|uniref:PTS ascorbate transporter subunit IIC n=1 Tax=Alkalibacterium sp. 20 TaxID=1798803 RepID=UPI0009003D47|nr:PTS ascorbate transporter subunit IIC [Alkalibacterium sp. 20]OJF94693.1 PTS ascorbate transporter subunit IIC [Alkalibacterium sp. 20]